MKLPNQKPQTTAHLAHRIGDLIKQGGGEELKLTTSADEFFQPMGKTSLNKSLVLNCASAHFSLNCCNFLIHNFVASLFLT